MTNRVALLRAVNLGPHGKVAMADLKAMVADLGYGNPRTLLQSGNVVFAAGDEADTAIEARLEAEAETLLGLKTEFMVRDLREWRAAIEANPFPDFARADPAHMVLMVMKRPAVAAEIDALRAAIKDREEVAAVGRQIYMTYPDDIGHSRLTPALIARSLNKNPGTGRNWNTVLKIAALLDG